MRRIAALLAAGVLALAIASPAAAVPVQNPGNQLYVTECGELEFEANASHLPGWNALWESGDVPWVLMGGTIVVDEVPTSTFTPPPGLVGKAKLVGPCTITPVGEDAGWYIRDAYLLVPVSRE